MAKEKPGRPGKPGKSGKPAKPGKASRPAPKAASGKAGPAVQRSSKIAPRPVAAPTGGKSFLVTCAECYEDWEIFPDGSSGAIVCPECHHPGSSPTGDTLIQMSQYKSTEARGLLICVSAAIVFALGLVGFVWMGTGTGDRPFTMLSEAIDERTGTVPVGSTEGFPEEGVRIRIGPELAAYGGAAGDSLTGVDRGVEGSRVQPHAAGTFVQVVEEVGSRPTMACASLGLALVGLLVTILMGIGYEKNRWVFYF